MLKTVFRISAASLALLHLLRIFIPSGTEPAMGAAAFIVLLSGVFLMGKGFRAATILFLAAGIAALALTRQPFAAWLRSLNSMTNTVAIMVVMQVFSIPVSMARCDVAIREWAEKKFPSDRSLFVFSTLITHVLTSFLMMGAIPVSLALVGSTVESRVEKPRQFLAQSLSRGYVLAALWAPGAINLYLVVQATGVSWSSILIPGFILAALGLGLSYAMECGPGGLLSKRPSAARLGGNSPAGEKSSGAAGMIQVLAAALSIVVIVILLEKLRIGAGYTRIMLAGLVVATVWTLALRNAKTFAAAAGDYWTEGILKVRDLGPFFVAMGIFSGALESSGLLALAGPYIQSAAAWLGLASIAILPLIIILLSLVGLHPFITLVLFGKILSGAGMPVSNLAIAISLASGGAAAYMISPFAGIIISLSRFTGARASEIAVKWNWKFSAAFYVLGIGFALFWGALFG